MKLTVGFFGGKIIKTDKPSARLRIKMDRLNSLKMKEKIIQ